MQRYLYNLIFFIILIITPVTKAQASFLLDELLQMDNSQTKQTTPPDPKNLSPHWWDYFAVQDDELRQRIISANKSLQDLLMTLPYDERMAAQPVVTKIIATVNALYQARKSDGATPQISPLLKNYTLEMQLEINKKIRKLTLDLKIEQDKINQLSSRISKSERTVDNMTVTYLADPTIIKGLELMSYRSNLELGKENKKLSEARLKELEAQKKRLADELIYSKDHLNLQEYDQKGLENEMTSAKQELDKRQRELVNAEGNLLGSFNDALHSSNAAYLLELQLLHASVNRAYAWSQLSFAHFKFNTVMHLNDKFQDAQHGLRNDLLSWRENIELMKQQANEWEKAALKEQDRVRQEYALLVAQNESDGQKMRTNQTMRQTILNIQATIELLEERMMSTESLIDMLESHLKGNSSWIYNCWVQVKWAFTNSWTKLTSFLNFSLVKINGIPITLYTLFKVATIIGLAFWLSVFVRRSLISFASHRTYLSHSSVYSLSSLVHYLILIVGFIVALASIGLDFSNLLFIAGALTFGISFGLQAIANNFFCGIRILFEKKLKIGDDIELPSGHHGKVIEIHVQNTVVKTKDGQRVIVPNSDLVSHTLVNWTKQAHDYRRLHIPFAVGADADKNFVRKVVIEAAKSVSCTLTGHSDHPDPEVWLESFNSHALNFKLVVWVDYKCATVTDSKEADFLWEIETALRKNKISFPSFDLHHLLKSPHKA